MVTRARLASGLLALVAAVVIALLYAVDPAESGLFPPCMFHLLTGLLCPGCGLTRAVHHLLHGDVATALSLNALLPVYLLLLGSLAAGWLWRETKGYTPRMLQVRASMVALAGVAMIGFGVLRNVI